MEIGNILDVKDRGGWRSWLAKHHQTDAEIWLVFYKKASGKTGITYNDAVMEALSYGWIDSTVKTLDPERYVQRFSKRNKSSGLSQMNLERVRALIREKRMTQSGLAAIAHVFDPAADKAEEFVIPTDILQPLKKNQQAWENFQQFPDDYKRVRIAYIESRKRHGAEHFQKSLEHFITMTAKNKHIGTDKTIK